MSAINIPQEISMILSSDTNSGAINKSTDGSYFEIQLQDGLSIPKDALNPTLEVQEASIWWTIPNIITGVNDKMYITGDDVETTTRVFTVTIPQGLYDLPGLSQAINRDLENQGAKISPSPLISMSPDEPTSKVEIRFNYANVKVDFTQAQTPREILGFNSTLLAPGFVSTLLAPNVAAFNQVNYFLIHSDLTNKGIRFNNNYSQVVSQVLINVAPGSQIVSTPFNPAKIHIPELTGTSRTNLRVWLTDDQGRPVNTNGESWSCRIVIRYIKPYVITRGS